MNIFEQLDAILKSINESEESAETKAEKIVKSIPVNPEMETEKQGLEKAWEKFAKYFYKLHAEGGGDGPISSTDEIDLPDDFLDPILKGKLSGKPQDKEFKKNKVLWDDEGELEKLKKEIELNIDGGGSDDFDDFDYKDNDFGDDDADTSELDTDDLDSSGGGGSSSSSSSDDFEKSEKDKLKDAIDKAIDKLRQDKESGGDSGSKKSPDSSKSGSESGSESGKESGSSSSSGSSSGSDSSGSSSGSEGGESSGSGTRPREGGKPMSEKDKRLTDLKNAIEGGDEGEFGKVMDDLKEGEDGSGKLAGEHRGEVSDEELKDDMKKAGFSDDDIEEIKDIKNTVPGGDGDGEMSKEELEKLKKDVIDGLEKKCEKRGGSALAKTIVKNALKSKIDNDEWRELLKLFLKGKSIMKGSTTKMKNRTVYGHKNHLWRGAVLPTKSYGHGEIQKIYCFVDFSGSVEQNLVYTFLGRVIDLCQELSYTDVVVYGFGERLVIPRTINGKMLKTKGKDVVLSQTWDYIKSQTPGGSIENFEAVSHEINEIRRKDRNSVFLIFGDGLWSDYGNPKPPIFLKNVCGAKVLDDICVLTYYTHPNSEYAGEIAYLKELVGLKTVITTKATSIRV